MFKLLVMLALVAGCGRDDCSVNTPCSANSPNHYQFCNGGSADDCFYVTGDGHKFHCLTCGDCTDARSLATSWCATAPKPGNNNSNTNPAGQTCQSGSCPVGGRSYSFCTTPTGSDCSYRASDGTVFACNGCSNCSAAAQSLSNWCTGGSSSSSGGSTTGGSTSDASCFSQSTNACLTCCATNHSDGANYYADGYITCGCAFCGSACSANGDVCHGGSTQTPECATCLGDVFQSQCATQLGNACAANAACSAFMACASNC